MIRTGPSPTAAATMARRSAPSGRRIVPGFSILVTSSPIRERRKVRVASRSRSCPTRYQRPLSVITPQGSTVRVTYGSVREGRCPNCTACPESMADNRIRNTDSDPRPPGMAAGAATETFSAAGSTSTPAARSFSSAPCAAVTSSGDCHNWVATATAADSSAVSVISGSS
ncbi:Uncharacterised protein [Mycobacteroides abscessus subsp. abscessus]|nr:Uncharacterised protein [Mycobacteroides abscessus subsp. abscessus]